MFANYTGSDSNRHGPFVKDTQTILSGFAIPVSVPVRTNLERMKMFRKNYTDQQIIDAAKESVSCAQLLRKLNLKPVGGNYATMKRKLFKLNIDCSHWTGQGWNKDKKLKNWENYTRASSCKKHLIKELGHKCEKCLISVWYDIPIPLEIHHVDGDRTNNTIENLQLLCPNCHACTGNWRGRKNVDKLPEKTTRAKIINIDKQQTKRKKIKEKQISTYSPPTKITWPDKDKLEDMIKNQSLCSIAKLLGVSDNAIRRRAKRYGIDIKSISRWSKMHGNSSKNW